MRMTLADRILSRISEVELGHATPCWVSDRGCCSGGYPQIRAEGRHLGVHQASYIAFVGPLPEGMTLDHVCHDPSTCAGGVDCPHRRCCNPEHLRPVTSVENVLRGNSPTGINKAKTHCIHGHPFNAANTRITREGKRQCRVCLRAATRRWQLRQSERRVS